MRTQEGVTTGLELEALRDVAAGMAQIGGAFAGEVPVDPRQRTGVLLVGTDLYDVWLLRWPAGQSVSPHDHGESAGAFSVVEGELTEVRWHDGVTQTRSVPVGGVVTVERGVVHDVIGAAVTSLSVHVYSPPLTSMRYYEAAGKEAVGVLEIDGAPLLSNRSA